MPRICTALLRRARFLHPLLPLLLRPCRDIPSARNELSWLREHILSTGKARGPRAAKYLWQHRLRQLCLQRSRGKPLQYILGSQPFGELEILCKPGVLIPRSLPLLYSLSNPRPETETLTSYLASLISCQSSKPDNQPPTNFRILDLCTGTACIPLLLHSLLSSSIYSLRICGVDISPAALDLAKKNIEHNIRHGYLRSISADQISFAQDDIFKHTGSAWRSATWDLVVSNPPYISPLAFNRTTSRSVRNYEPKSALVPVARTSPTSSTVADTNTDTDIGDMFYPRLLHLAATVNSKILLVEVADLAQATRVGQMIVASGKWEGCEIWRDWPAAPDAGGEVAAEGTQIRVRGEGNGRAVLAWRGEGVSMLGR
ncbi:hypothetical protein MMC28_008436 [Mycoblastus sanguinarius]|nr:hypothetical protein [Mycoblastus sanguinarius]